MGRTRRRWHHPKPAVGLVGPHDVRALQAKIHDYRSALQVSVDRAAGTSAALAPAGAFSVADWGDVVGRCVTYESESADAWNPLAYFYAGSAYDRGRELIAELDRWRDELDRRGAPNVPAAIPVPYSDLSLLGAVGIGAGALLALLILHELRSL